jgi:Putative phage abortive infection protein
MLKPELEMKRAWRIVKSFWILPVLGIILIKTIGIDFAQLGPFGDFVAGTIVPILTFASFLMVVATLGMQREQLEMQSTELRNSIEEMKTTRKEFEEQNKTMAVQRFENTFFQMVNLHNQIVSSMQINGQYPKTGKNVFPFIFEFLKHSYNRKRERDLFTGTELIDWIRESYEEFFNSYENQLGHYFRNLYRIVKFIDEVKLLDYEEKKTYIGIIKAQLSSSELSLLLYNGLSDHGTNFFPLIKKYNLLDNLNQNLLINPMHYKVFQDHKVE